MNTHTIDAGEAVISNSTKLVYQSISGEDYVVADMTMPRQASAVREDNIRTKVTIMGNMTIGHDEIIVGNAGYAFILNCAAINRDVFAEDIVITDANFSRVSLVGNRLRRCPYGSKWEEMIILTNCGVSIDYHV